MANAIIDQHTKIDTFILELKKHVKLLPCQEQIVRKTLLDRHPNEIRIIFGRQNGLTHLHDLYKNIFEGVETNAD